LKEPPDTYTQKPAATLVFTWGNPSRGDDAIGPLIYDRLLQATWPQLEVLTDFQLQIEHTLDLEQRQKVIFVDASVSAHPPFDFYRLTAEHDSSYTSHAMSPQSLLAVYQQVNRRPTPDSFMLSIRAYQFELGQAISTKAMENVHAAMVFLEQQITS